MNEIILYYYQYNQICKLYVWAANLFQRFLNQNFLLFDSDKSALVELQWKLFPDHVMLCHKECLFFCLNHLCINFIYRYCKH